MFLLGSGCAGIPSACPALCPASDSTGDPRSLCCMGGEEFLTYTHSLMIIKLLYSCIFFQE